MQTTSQLVGARNKTWPGINRRTKIPYRWEHDAERKEQDDPQARSV